jgi:GH25 family lysozyme M1 (1,4-beta-N-acetylmuramidase)
MIQINTVDLSEFQDPKEVDYQAMKDAGIKNLIIRGSVDLRLDHHAAEHIANAKKYGFNWHLYHYFYNDTNEADFAVKAAKSLGLGKDQILFLDMEDKSLPENWNEQFSIFRKAVGNSFKVGLYCSDSPYNAKFSDNQLKQLGVIRWIASYSYEPKNYDVWQRSGSGSGGFGTYTKDIDRDVDPNNILAISSSKPYVPTSEDKMVRQIILQAGYDTETGIYGLGCSFDNGATFKVYWTIYGQKFYQEDADRLWPFLKNKITNAMSVDWDSIQNKPKFVTPDELEARLDKLSVPTVKWADIEDKPPIPSIDGLAKQSDLDNVKATADSAESKAEQAQSTADVNTKALQNVYTKEEADQKYWTAEQEQNASNVKSVNNIEPDDQGNVDIDLTEYAKINDIPQSMTWSQITGKPNVATKDDVDYLKTLIGSSSGSGDAGLTIEAIVELIKHHLKAKVDVNSGNLLIDVDGVSNGSIADAVATKVAQSLQFKLQGSDLVAEIGGTE